MGTQPARRRIQFSACLCALMAFAPALSRATEDVFKCRDAEGLVSYQDHRCPPGTEQPAPVILEAPEFIPPAPDALAAAAPPPKTPGEAPYYPPPPPETQYRCVDAISGKPYVTGNPPQSGRYVPLWTVLPRGMTLASRQTDLQPMTTRPPAHLAGSYTYVEDRCRPMPVGELCGYWRQHMDEVHAAKRVAFNDTRPALEQEEDGLRQQLGSYCGG